MEQLTGTELVPMTPAEVRVRRQEADDTLRKAQALMLQPVFGHQIVTLTTGWTAFPLPSGAIGALVYGARHDGTFYPAVAADAADTTMPRVCLVKHPAIAIEPTTTDPMTIVPLTTHLVRCGAYGFNKYTMIGGKLARISEPLTAEPTTTDPIGPNDEAHRSVEETIGHIVNGRVIPSARAKVRAALDKADAPITGREARDAALGRALRIG